MSYVFEDKADAIELAKMQPFACVKMDLRKRGSVSYIVDVYASLDEIIDMDYEVENYLVEFVSVSLARNRYDEVKKRSYKRCNATGFDVDGNKTLMISIEVDKNDEMYNEPMKLIDRISNFMYIGDKVWTLATIDDGTLYIKSNSNDPVIIKGVCNV